MSWYIALLLLRLWGKMNSRIQENKKAYFFEFLYLYICICIYVYIWQKQPLEVLWKFRNIDRKTLALESLFNKVTAKETPRQMFCSEYCESFKNTYFQEHLQTTGSLLMKAFCDLVKGDTNLKNLHTTTKYYTSWSEIFDIIMVLL